MKRALLVVSGIFISIFFSVYILGTGMFRKNELIGCQNDGTDDSGVVKVAEAAHVQNNKPSETAKQYSIDATQTTAVAPVQETRTEMSSPEPVCPEGWELVWADEFDKPNIDMEYWTRIDRKESFNHELQYYLPANSYIENGCLYLTTKKEDKDGKKYTSAMVETREKLSVYFGRIEIRIKLPAGKGLFPAFWMLDINGLYEADVLEMVGNEPDIVYGVNHFRKSVRQKTYGSIECGTTDKFHVYALEWEKDELRWYLDDRMYHRTSKGIPADEMYLILTLAVGGDWPGNPNSKTVFPCSMVVDYIRVYSKINQE